MRMSKFAGVLVAAGLALVCVNSRADGEPDNKEKAYGIKIYNEGPKVFKRDVRTPSGDNAYVVTVTGCDSPLMMKLDATTALLRCGERDVGLIKGGRLVQAYNEEGVYISNFYGVYSTFQVK